MNKVAKYLYFIVICLILTLAFAVRIKTYLLARPLWHDECSLALSILTRNVLGLFQPLENEQKAPIIFMLLNKVYVSFLGIKEISIKFIPFISGLFSIILFYCLSKRILENKLSIIAANFIFAINYQLIYWAQKFKQYSFDVFLVLASILLFSKLDLEKISYKKCFLYSIVGLLLILAAFPCIFIVAGYILYCLLNKINIKKILSFSFPLIISSVFYYFKFLYNVKESEVTKYFNYWQNGFLTLNINSIITIFRGNFNFFFNPNTFALIGVILFLIGFLLLLKDSKKINRIILFSFPGIILASSLQIYPIWQRTALYLLPIIILYITKPLDLLSKNNKVVSIAVVGLLIIYFYKYNFSYITGFFKQNAFIKTDAITIFPKLVEKYRNSDVLVINSSTKPDIVYYCRIYNFNPKNAVLVPVYRFDKEYYYEVLNSLPRGKNYWFIFGWEYSHESKFSSIQKNLESYIKDKHLKLLEEYKDSNSLLIKVKI